MKYDFKILNHDAELEVLHVRYTPHGEGLDAVRLRLPMVRGVDGKWPDRDDILLSIRKNAPVEQWRRKVAARNLTARDLQPIADLVGYQEKAASRPPITRVSAPRQFPSEGVI